MISDSRTFLRGSAALFLLFAILLTCGCSSRAILPQLPEKPAESEYTAAQPLHESDYADYFKSLADQNKQISVLLAGDNVIHPSLYMEAGRRTTASSRKYNFLPMYEDVRAQIEAADIAFINQETLMAGDDKYGLSGYPMFNSPQDLGYELAELGFDIVGISNNHMLDQGASGLADTLDFYDTMDYLMIGGYRNAEDYDTLRVYEEQGVRIGLLSYTYGTNGITLPSSSELIVPYLDRDTVRRQVSAARARDDIDLVFVSVHWGIENTTAPDEEQREYAQIMADSGADVIIGHHPHMIQPIEWIHTGRAHDTLCIYSLGNLVSAMMYSANMIGGFVTFDILVTDGSLPYIGNVAFTPTVFFYGMDYYSTHLYYMEDYNQDLASRHGTRIYGSGPSYTYTYEDLKNFVKRIIDPAFLPEFLQD